MLAGLERLQYDVVTIIDRSCETPELRFCALRTGLNRAAKSGIWPDSWIVVLAWLVEQALDAFQPPPDGVLCLVADGTLMGKRAQRMPSGWNARRRYP
jgi:hypothetical protein